ncbi:MAG: hypothetical protein ABEJ99_00800 [Candidatus Nanohaloarchaea archaeon]
MPEFFGVEWEETDVDEKDEMYVSQSDTDYVKDRLSDAGFSWIKARNMELGTYHSDDDYSGSRAHIHKDKTYLFLIDREI